MKNMTLATRIRLGFAILVALLLTCGAVSMLALRAIDTQVAETTERDLSAYTHVSELRVHMGNLRRFEKDYLINITSQEKRAEYLQKWRGSMEAAQNELKALLAGHEGSDDHGPKLATLRDKLTSYGKGFEAMSGQAEQGALASTQDGNAALGTVKQDVHEMEALLKEISAEAAKTGDTLREHIDTLTGATITQLGTLIVVSLLIAGVVSFTIVRSIRIPLRAMSEASTRLAETHDLRQPIPDAGRNEIGQVGGALRHLVERMRELIGDSLGHSQRLVQASEHLSKLSQQVATSTHQQAAAASASAAAIEQMTVSINVVSSNAQSAEEQTRAAAREASQGSERATRAASDIRQIADSITQTSERIDQLARRSDEIGSIVQVIHDIAEQTNLLALNAAIEAARAGEFGRGFAVVADEVRKLAERTSQATSEISSRIQAVQSDTQGAYQSMQEANQRIEIGVTSAAAVSEALEQIRSLSEQALSGTAEIALTIREQSQASQSIAQNVEQIAQMNEHNSRSVEQSSQLAHELQQLSHHLDECLNRFRI